MKELVLGIDIGGTKCAVVLGQMAGADQAPVLLGRRSFPTQVPGDVQSPRGPEAALGRILEAAQELLAGPQARGGKLRAAGISCGGPLDSRRGLVLSPPNLPGWTEVPVVEAVGGRLGVPARLENDANACALAEWRFGAARGTRNAVFLTFGTGMGAGLLLDGRLYSGTNDLAGEVGHLRLAEHGPVGHAKAGSFEGFCSGGGIAELARIKVLERVQAGQAVGLLAASSLGAVAQPSAEQVAEAARAGDALALEILQLSGRYLGRGLAILVDLLNPEIIVIGSIFARAGELFWPAAREELEREALAPALRFCRVVPAALGERLGDYAALSVALQAAAEEET